EACVRVFEQTGNRDNKLRARMKWVVDELGFEELQRRIFASRKFLMASSSWPGGIPTQVTERRRRARGHRRWRGHPGGPGPAGVPAWHHPRAALGRVQRGARHRQGHRVGAGLVAARRRHRGRSSGASLRSAATSTQRCASRTARTSCCRGLTDEQLPSLYERLAAIDMAEPGAELSRDVVACPGADTCNLAVTQSRGLAERHQRRRLEAAGLAEVERRAHQHLGLHQLLRPAPHRRHRVLRCRAPGPRPAPPPATQMLLGGYVGDETRSSSATEALRLPAKAAAAGRRAGRAAASPTERELGETFQGWLDRVRRRHGRRRGPRRPRRVPHPGRRARLLRRLRRDRPLRERGSASRSAHV
ncbi:MAG: hypothetical protein V9E94_01420, partial [Microthrixaceae bacterium]